MIYTKKFLFFLAATILVISNGCDPDDPVDDHDHDHEEELITTFSYTLTPTDYSPPVILYFQDLDGDGGEEPTVSVTGNFKSNTSYLGIISLLNEDEGHDVGDEVKEEAAEHQFFFSSTVNGVEVSYGDMDGNGNPLGLETTLKTAAAGSGTFTVTLLHEPDKTASGVAEGRIDNAGGSTDLEVTFSIVVE